MPSRRRSSTSTAATRCSPSRPRPRPTRGWRSKAPKAAWWWRSRSTSPTTDPLGSSTTPAATRPPTPTSRFTTSLLPTSTASRQSCSPGRSVRTPRFRWIRRTRSPTWKCWTGSSPPPPEPSCPGHVGRLGPFDGAHRGRIGDHGRKGHLGCTEEAGVHPEGAADDADLLAGGFEHHRAGGGFQRLLQVGKQLLVEPTDDHHVGIEDVEQAADAVPQPGTGRLEGLEGLGVADLDPIGDLFDQPLADEVDEPGPFCQRRLSRFRLPTAPGSTAAFLAVGVDQCVTRFP